MKRHGLNVLKLSELDAWPTKRLLARLKRLQQCEQSISLSDQTENIPTDLIRFKDSPEWIAEYDYLKGLLSKREHIS